MTFNSSTTESMPSVSGGGLPNMYKLARIIFHWGKTSGSGWKSYCINQFSTIKLITFIIKGSEHTKSFTSYPMEVQLIHFKDSLGDVETALSTLEWDSLAIVSILFFVRIWSTKKKLKTFLQLQLANTQAVAPYMDIVSNALHKITQPDTETQVFRIDNSLWEGF